MILPGRRFYWCKQIIISLVLFCTTLSTVHGQGDIVLKFRHRTFTGITRKLNLYPATTQYLTIKSQDTVVYFTGGKLVLLDDLFIKQTRYDSIAIPLGNIRSLRAGKDMLVGMGGVMLSVSALVLGMDVITGSFNEQQNLSQAWTPYIALAAGSGALIAIGAIRSSYNLRRWKLVAIEDKRTPWPNGEIPP
jgi:hypothetical protein